MNNVQVGFSISALGRGSQRVGAKRRPMTGSTYCAALSGRDRRRITRSAQSGPTSSPTVIASAAKQSMVWRWRSMDCVVASAPRNDEPRLRSIKCTVTIIGIELGGFTNEVQHVEFLSLAVARLASPVVHCFMIGAAVKGDPQERGARAHP